MPASVRIEDYLAEDDVIDYSAACIRALSDTLSDEAEDITGYIKLAYEYVRDHISHSADI